MGKPYIVGDIGVKGIVVLTDDLGSGLSLDLSH